MTRHRLRIFVAAALAVAITGGLVAGLRSEEVAARIRMVAYFTSSTGVYQGDEVRILGIPVGKIDRIEPQGTQVKISFWYDAKYQVPADAKAVIVSPTLVPARALQLTPAYRSGPLMADNAVIPLERTAVPVEWDDMRIQLERLSATLQPTQPGV